MSYENTGPDTASQALYKKEEEEEEDSGEKDGASLNSHGVTGSGLVWEARPERERGRKKVFQSSSTHPGPLPFKIGPFPHLNVRCFHFHS